MNDHIIMSGMRATGTLHLGHLLGVITNWLTLQQQYNCYFMAADWHMLTTAYDRTQDLQTHTKGLILDWLSAGVDPDKSVLYVQSAVLETAELHLLLSMITPVNWLERDPTLKDIVRELKIGDESLGYGLLGYPLLQTADILGVGGNLVPVGEDQVAHIELSRDIVRKFHHIYQTKDTDLFREPKPLLTETPVLFGLDGRKMSKSYYNDIKLNDAPDIVKTKVKTMVTDPSRIRKTDPGHPETCTVFGMTCSMFPEAAPEVASRCIKAEIGCMACKNELADRLNLFLEPIQTKRQELSQNPDKLDEIIAQGNQKARLATQKTLTKVRSAMGLNQWV
jgi:tryptophanyl-tRNA synthetase